MNIISVTFPSTGSWTTWAEDVKINVSLNNNAANRIQFSSAGGDLANIDQISIIPSIDWTPRVLQAETATLGGGSVIESSHTGFHGAGYINFAANGSTMTFTNVDGNGGGSKTLSPKYKWATASPLPNLYKSPGESHFKWGSLFAYTGHRLVHLWHV